MAGGAFKALNSRLNRVKKLFSIMWNEWQQNYPGLILVPEALILIFFWGGHLQTPVFWYWPLKEPLSWQLKLTYNTLSYDLIFYKPNVYLMPFLKAKSLTWALWLTILPSLRVCSELALAIFWKTKLSSETSVIWNIEVFKLLQITFCPVSEREDVSVITQITLVSDCW